MRVDVKKVLFLGAAAKKEAFLEGFQKAGLVQFIGTKISTYDLLATDFQEVVQAIKILHSFDVVQTPRISVSDPIAFSRRVIAEKNSLENLCEQLKEEQEIFDFISPVGKIPLKEIRALEAQAPIHFRLWTASKKKNMRALCPHLIKISSTPDREYFVSLTKEEIEVPPGLEPIPLTAEIQELSDRLERTQIKIGILETELKRKSAYITSLKQSLVSELNQTKRERASKESYSALEDHLFAITAWIPETDLEKAQELASSLHIFFEEIALDPDEVPPTHLKNEHVAKIGEDLVDIYDTPSHTDKDPSLWVLAFFSIFFAMIIDDGGYGLVFLASALLLRKKASTKGAKRAVALTAILGTVCVLWGACTHSFFSIQLSPKNPMRANSPLTYLIEKKGLYHLKNRNDPYVRAWRQSHLGAMPRSLNDFLYEQKADGSTLSSKLRDSLLMELSVLIGAIHIIISMLRYLRRNIAHFGWILSIIGGYLYCATYVEASSILFFLTTLTPEKSAYIGPQIIGGGLFFVLISSIATRGLSGITELTAAVQIFGDVLSYLRIYALALAGSMIGTMANELSAHLPFIIASFLITISHIVNIAMSIIGGIIHGLRLNFLEWYHYSFEGGGKQFSPFKLETFHK